MTNGRTVFEVVSGTDAEICATLEGYLSSKDASSLRVLCTLYSDGTDHKILVRYVEKIT